MLLAIDTATRWTGLALYDTKMLIAELGWHAVNTQTIELAPTLAELLRKAEIGFEQIDAVAVAIGPGSYTGLRVGLGFAKGIALAAGKPLIGVNTLDIVVAAFDRPDERHLVAVCEAGRKRVCAAVYRWYSRKGWQLKREADIFTWDELLKSAPNEALFAGEISIEARTKIRFAGKRLRAASASQSSRRAGHLAELAYNRLRKGEVDDAAALAPVYLRNPAGAK